jgi:hypothetical protein
LNLPPPSSRSSKRASPGHASNMTARHPVGDVAQRERHDDDIVPRTCDMSWIEQRRSVTGFHAGVRRSVW